METSLFAGQARIAYFILVHRLPGLFKRMFHAIYHPDNYYLVHLDKKAGPDIRKVVSRFLADYPNASILESENVVWGGYSMVQAELNGMNCLLSKYPNWDFFINLSGQDFPLQTQKNIRLFLARNRGKNFIKIAKQATERPDTMNRIDNHFTETETGFSQHTHKRPFMKGVTSYIGGQWMILNRTCCEFICRSNEVKKFEDYYLNTLIPDESFFQTVLMNTSFNGTIINDDKRAIIWIPDGDIKLRPKTFTIEDIDFLMSGSNLFARKFDIQVDEHIIDLIELTALPQQVISA
jgi:hypothetical protein